MVLGPLSIQNPYTMSSGTNGRFASNGDLMATLNGIKPD